MAFNTSESLDTNTILRFLLGDIPGQREIVSECLRRPGVLYHVSDLAITEAVYVMQQKHRSRSDIVQMLQGFFKRLNVQANFNLFNEVFPMYLQHPKLSFNDCCLAVYATLNQAEPLWTFDHALARQAPAAKLLG